MSDRSFWVLVGIVVVLVAAVLKIWSGWDVALVWVGGAALWFVLLRGIR